jgi:hypothetical protein
MSAGSHERRVLESPGSTVNVPPRDRVPVRDRQTFYQPRTGKRLRNEQGKRLPIKSSSPHRDGADLPAAYRSGN